MVRGTAHHPSGTEVLLADSPQELRMASPTSHPSLSPWQPQLNGKPVQGPSPSPWGGTALKGIQTSELPLDCLGALVGTVTRLIFCPVLLPSTPVPSTGWSQECTLINISRASRHLRNCFLGNPTCEQSSLLFPQYLKNPFPQGFCNCCSFCL